MADARDDTRWSTTGADNPPDDLVRAVAALLLDLVDLDDQDQDQDAA